MMPSKDSRIVIVGAGVFGLSTALHLLQRGYRDIHIFDRQPYDQNHYAVNQGADAASADENKILRASYGGRKLYQDLAFQAMSEWHEWNKALAKTDPADLPPTLDPSTKLWHNCYYLRLSDPGLEPSEVETQKNFPDDLKHTQYRVSSARRRLDAVVEGIPESKIDPFERFPRGLSTDGYLDTTAGFVLASRACAFVLHRLQKSPHVTTHLGPDHAVASLVRPDGGSVTAIATASGETHPADLVVVASGGWTPALVPEVERLLETTAGSVLNFQLPRDNWDLWEKFSPKNFPVWSWNMETYTPPPPPPPSSSASSPPDARRSNTSIGGLYGLPRTPEGIVKVAFRGAKWTSYTRTSPRDGSPLSFPKTDTTTPRSPPPQKAPDRIPAEAMRVLRTFCAANLPDLAALPVASARLCWYTDSADNDFLVSAVPGVARLFVASGGSGHGFKFLPVLGAHVVDVLEGTRTAYTERFAWREPPPASPGQARNGLEEGPAGWRNLDKQTMVGVDEWQRQPDEDARSKL